MVWAAWRGGVIRFDEPLVDFFTYRFSRPSDLCAYDVVYVACRRCYGFVTTFSQRPAIHALPGSSIALPEASVGVSP